MYFLLFSHSVPEASLHSVLELLYIHSFSLPSLPFPVDWKSCCWLYSHLNNIIRAVTKEQSGKLKIMVHRSTLFIWISGLWTCVLTKSLSIKGGEIFFTQSLTVCHCVFVGAIRCILFPSKRNLLVSNLSFILDVCDHVGRANRVRKKLPVILCCLIEL